MIESVATQAKGSEDTTIHMLSVIHHILDENKVTLPRLQHGEGPVTRAVLKDAVNRGGITRIGLEDTLYDLDGSRANNKSLVQIAYKQAQKKPQLINVK